MFFKIPICKNKYLSNYFVIIKVIVSWNSQHFFLLNSAAWLSYFCENVFCSYPLFSAKFWDLLQNLFWKTQKRLAICCNLEGNLERKKIKERKKYRKKERKRGEEREKNKWKYREQKSKIGIIIRTYSPKYEEEWSK